jgi:hypothetical protein
MGLCQQLDGICMWCPFEGHGLFVNTLVFGLFQRHTFIDFVFIVSLNCFSNFVATHQRPHSSLLSAVLSTDF